MFVPFFCPANIYWPSLGKVRLGRPNPKPLQPLNFYLRRKKKLFYSELYAQLIRKLIFRRIRKLIIVVSTMRDFQF